MKIYNTLTRKKEVFKPIVPKKIGMYVCGPTVYGPGHIGHARTYILFDIIRKCLEYKRYKVKFIMNITDIHDDIIKEAKKLNIDFKRLADKFSQLFFKDLESLKIKKADKYPRVTEHIKEIIEMVKILEKKGFAYKTGDGIYYDISKFKDYGKLSGIKLEEAKTGTRVKTDKYEKEELSDFALWKFTKPGEPSWKSPWGEGRPGWHIECSVMSQKYLGQQFDIHGGARDLIFPHHENEIAQSEAASGKKPFVKYWLHSGLITINKQKMSRSLGNFIEIPDLLKKYSPEEIRFFMLGADYRSPLDYNEKTMRQAKAGLERINEFVDKLKKQTTKGKEQKAIKGLIEKTKKQFTKFMGNDFDTLKSLSAIFNLVKEGNKLINKNQLTKTEAQKILNFLEEIDKIFGILKEEKIIIPEEIKKLVEERKKYRKEKNWKMADETRKRIKNLGYWVEDTDKGPVIKRT